MMTNKGFEVVSFHRGRFLLSRGAVFNIRGTRIKGKYIKKKKMI